MRRPFAKVRYQALLAVRFRSQFQHLLLPHQIHRQGARHDVGKLFRHVTLDVPGIVAINDCVAHLIQLYQFTPDTRFGRPVAIVEVIDMSFEEGVLAKRFRVEQLHDAKWRASYRQDVHSSVFVALNDLNYLRCAAHADDAFWKRQEHAEFTPVVEAPADHLAIPWLEDMQGKVGAG